MQSHQSHSKSPFLSSLWSSLPFCILIFFEISHSELCWQVDQNTSATHCTFSLLTPKLLIQPCCPHLTALCHAFLGQLCLLTSYFSLQEREKKIQKKKHEIDIAKVKMAA